MSDIQPCSVTAKPDKPCPVVVGKPCPVLDTTDRQQSSKGAWNLTPSQRILQRKLHGRKLHRYEWQELIQTKAQDVRADLVPFLPCKAEQRSRIQHIIWLIDYAEDAAQTPSNLSDWWRGSLQERAWPAIHQARVEIIELPGQDGELRARARDIVLKAREMLPKNDPRLQEVSSAVFSPNRKNKISSNRAKNKKNSDSPNENSDSPNENSNSPNENSNSPLVRLRPAIAYLAAAAYRQADKQYAQSRNFRNRLIRLTGIALVADMFVLAAGFRGLFDFVVPGSNRVRTTLLIALFGTVGAFLSAVHPLARNQGIRNPFNLPLYQLLLKLALGPLFAILGVALITTQTTQTSSAMSSPLHLLVWATGFGMMQQAVTYQVDQRVRGLLAPSASSRSGLDDCYRDVN